MGLPIDVVNAILEAAYLNRDSRPDYDTLRHCALVCRAWNVHAQRLCFRWVTIRTPSCAKLLQDHLLLSTQLDNPRMRRSRAAVRILQLSTTVEASFILDFLNACNHVHELRFETQLAVQQDVISAFRTAGSSLRNMRLTAPSSLVLVQMLEALPALARVEVHLMRFDAPALADADGLDESPVPWPATISRLRELRVSADVVPVDETTRTAYATLFSLPEQPEALSYSSPDIGTGPFLPPFDQLGMLRSLALDAWTDALASATAELPQLTELVLHQTATVRTSKAFIDTLPQRLIHLAIPGSDAFFAERKRGETRAVSRLHATVPTLQAVTLHATTLATFGQWVHMFALCLTQMGIEVRKRTSQHMVAEIDLIPVTAVPRTRECTNYSFMAPPAAPAPPEPDVDVFSHAAPADADIAEELDVLMVLQAEPLPAHPFTTAVPNYGGLFDPTLAGVGWTAEPALSQPTQHAASQSFSAGSNANSGASGGSDVSMSSGSGSLRARWKRTLRNLRSLIPKTVRAR